MKLWLVRHAQPLIAPGLCYGRLDMATAAAATAECARRLAFELPAGIQVAASPLQRCGQLALALQALRPDLSCQTDARLQEMDFGRWEGRAWQAVDPAELQAWTDDFADYPVGRTGESVSAFMARVAWAFDALEGPGDTLWITHAGVIRAVELLAQGVRHIERADQWPLDAPNYGQWQTLEWPIEPAQVVRRSG
ncbi:MAG: histidine phosphatase family protein [Pseudomonadota bacterium]|nr:histidine phosphatase family protein [Pseudomonadota bacterium]